MQFLSNVLGAWGYISEQKIQKFFLLPPSVHSSEERQVIDSSTIKKFKMCILENCAF